MEIYRVQDEYGEGPFCSGAFGMGGRHADPARFPNLYDDFARSYLHSAWGEVSGVHTRELVNYWFNENERKELVKLGYKITVWDIHPDFVKFGKSLRQILFDKSKATLLRTEELVS